MNPQKFPWVLNNYKVFQLHRDQFPPCWVTPKEVSMNKGPSVFASKDLGLEATEITRKFLGKSRRWRVPTFHILPIRTSGGPPGRFITWGSVRPPRGGCSTKIARMDVFMVSLHMQRSTQQFFIRVLGVREHDTMNTMSSGNQKSCT